MWWTADQRPTPERSPGGLAERTIEASCGVPVLDRSGVYWVAPEFDASLESLHAELRRFRGWELHTTAVRATTRTLDALRASASRSMHARLEAISVQLEELLATQRLRASMLVRQHDALEQVRKQDEVNRRHLALAHEGLPARLNEWERRIETALCARIVA